MAFRVYTAQAKLENVKELILHGTYSQTRIIFTIVCVGINYKPWRQIMAQYVITYLGGMGTNPPSDPEVGKAHQAKYMQWIGSLGDAAVSPMNPFKSTNTISTDGTVTKGSSIGMSGYTIIQAESMEAALEIAKACPFLEVDGTLEVSELMQMG